MTLGLVAQRILGYTSNNRNHNSWLTQDADHVMIDWQRQKGKMEMSKNFKVGDKVTFTKRIKDLYRNGKCDHKNDEYDLCKMIDYLDEPMNVVGIDDCYCQVKCELAGVECYRFHFTELELFDIGLIDEDALIRIDLTVDEINEIITNTNISDDLANKLDGAKISAIESAKKNKIAKAIEENFGIAIKNQEVINLSGDKIIHVDTDNGVGFVRWAIVPGDKKGRFFRFDETLSVNEIHPKIRVVTKTEVDWSDEDLR